MKPLSICLVNKSKDEPKCLSSHPDDLPKSVLKKIISKSIPKRAKDGTFISKTIDDYTFYSYAFVSEKSDELLSLVLVFEEKKYTKKSMKLVFQQTVTELQRHNLDDSESLLKLIPSLYQGFIHGSINFKVTSVVTIEMDISKEKKTSDEIIQDFSEDIWD